MKGQGNLGFGSELEEVSVWVWVSIGRFSTMIRAGQASWLILLIGKIRSFRVVDDIFCLFEGHIENVAHLKQQYVLNRTANEVITVIETYRISLNLNISGTGCGWECTFLLGN
ncbi:stem-specific TSJT1-like [Olea europaea subsp. europaea]|uniref:Stem-specific TSJT1-like n=1 Tax=Olea europaea subsp. europaea TaxID=158383 RepID=A0A8S0PGP3_OLEEU|nr:stem-specific TSJT1-like [Olea europaea subsp. europaea]